MPERGHRPPTSAIRELRLARAGRARPRVRRLLSLALLLAAPLAPARGQPSESAPASTDPGPTPQRPTVSFSAATVPDGAWELESGARILEDAAAAILFLKHGLTRRLELELGLEPVRQVSTGDGTTASLGDALIGLRHRFWEDGARSLAWAALAKVPTARTPVGSEEWDASGLLVYSDASHRLAWDANLWISAMGRENGSRLGQVLATFVTALPGRGCWSPFIEVAVQSTASEGDGGYVDAGAFCSVSPRATLDFGAGAGWGDGFPGWTVDIGFTVRFGASR